MLASVKTAQYDLTQGRKEVYDILEKVRSATGPDNGSLALWNATIKTVPLCRESEEYLNRCFAQNPKGTVTRFTQCYPLTVDTEKGLYHGTAPPPGQLRIDISVTGSGRSRRKSLLGISASAYEAKMR